VFPRLGLPVSDPQAREARGVPAPKAEAEPWASAPASEIRAAADLRILRSRSLCLRSADDLAARAEEVERRSFGRSATFSGQLPGQLARVVCPERSFSRFTELLLARLRSSADVLRRSRSSRRAPSDLLRRVRFLGLDENATLIFDGSDAVNGSAQAGPQPHAPADRSALVVDRGGCYPGPDRVHERGRADADRLVRQADPGPVPPARGERRGGRKPSPHRLDRDVPAEDLALDAPE
jgi:hypothetical protein